MQGSLWLRTSSGVLQHLVFTELSAMQVGRNSDPVRRVLQTLHAFGAPEVSCCLGALVPPQDYMPVLPAAMLPLRPQSWPTCPL